MIHHSSCLDDPFSGSSQRLQELTAPLAMDDLLARISIEHPPDQVETGFDSLLAEVSELRGQFDIVLGWIRRVTASEESEGQTDGGGAGQVTIYEAIAEMQSAS